MHVKSIIFIVIASILTIAFYNPAINFLSAAGSECFGGDSVDQYLCVSTFPDGTVLLIECTVTKDPYHIDCQPLDRENILPPGLKAEIDANVRQEVQSNTNDAKDLGILKNDNGIELSPGSK